VNRTRENETYASTEVPIPSPRLPSVPLFSSPVDPVMPHVLLDNLPRKLVFVRLTRKRDETGRKAVQRAREN
jgi:hypothetical protein